MIVVDPEFKDLIPPLSNEEFQQLEENCVRDGIRDFLVIWPQEDGTDILIDGHNRWRIVGRHPNLLSPLFKRIQFKDRNEAKEWIIKNQLGRRNIPAYVRAELALKLKPVIAERAKEKQASHTEQGYQKSDKAVHTTKELAKAAGVSHDTIHKVEVIREKADPEVIDKLRKGETTIHKEYVNIMAAEHESRKQEEARKLREAKERRKEFESYLEECTAEDAGNVVSFNSIKQNNDDKELIFQDFNRGFESAIDGIRSYAGMIDSGRFKESIEMANKYELERLADHVEQLFKAALKLQHVIQEVLDEK